MVPFYGLTSERLTLTELAQKYDLHPNQITQWKREFLEKASEVFTKGEKALKTEEDFKQKAVMLYKTIGQKSIGLKKNFIDQTPVRAAFYD